MAEREDLEGRLRALEVRLRAQRRFTAALAALALGGALAAALRPASQVVRGRRFEIVDRQGAVLGGFGIGAQAGEARALDHIDPGWVFKSPGCGSRASLRVANDGPFASLHLDVGGEESASMAAGSAGGSLGLSSGNGRSTGLAAAEGQTFLAFHRTVGMCADLVLHLSHSDGMPAFRGWGNQVQHAIDFP